LEGLKFHQVECVDCGRQLKYGQMANLNVKVSHHEDYSFKDKQDCNKSVIHTIFVKNAFVDGANFTFVSFHSFTRRAATKLEEQDKNQERTINYTEDIAESASPGISPIVDLVYDGKL
jgi:hypothetical protein